jgi:hypothetical protein
LVLITFFAVVAQANMFTNGEFGTGTSGWTLGNGAASTGASVLLNSTGVATDPFVEQLVNGFDSGSQYTISWQLKLHVNYGNRANGHSFGVILDPGSSNTRIYSGEWLGSTWEDFSTSFTATKDSYLIRFAGEMDGSDVSYYFDNVKLEKLTVPEPSLILLLGMGLAGVAVFRKRLS